MTKKPALGVVYKAHIIPYVGVHSALAYTQLYSISTRIIRFGGGKSSKAPQYSAAGRLKPGDLLVAIDFYKSRDGHDEVYVVTSTGLCGWIALQTSSCRKMLSFVRVK